MLTHPLSKRIVRPCLLAILLGTASVSLIPTLAMTAGSSFIPAVSGVLDSTPAGLGLVATRTEVRDAAERFLLAMSAADAEAVWMFASEEEHDAFGTEETAYDAYADAFPALTRTHGVSFEKFWQEGDTPFVRVALTSGSTPEYSATIGLWLDDAGDWKIVSCDVKPVSDLVAGL
jgi:hypothetical protein